MSDIIQIMSDIVFAIFDIVFSVSNYAFRKSDIYRKKFGFISKIFCIIKNIAYICGITKEKEFHENANAKCRRGIKQGNVPTGHTNPDK